MIRGADRRLERGADDGAAQHLAARRCTWTSRWSSPSAAPMPTSFAPGASRRSTTRSSSSLLGAGGGVRPVPRPVAAPGLRPPRGERRARAPAERRAARAGAAGRRPGPVGLGPARRPLRAQPGDAPASSATSPARSATSAASGTASSIRVEPGADARRGRGALPRRDRGLRVRVPGAAQERPLGLAAEPRQGGRARRVRHRRAHGRHAHGPDAGARPPRRRWSARPRCCKPHRRAGAASAAGSSTSRPCASTGPSRSIASTSSSPGSCRRSRTRSTSTRRTPSRRIRAAVEAGARDGTPWDLELPFVTAKGNPRWVRAQGIAAMRGRPAGAPARRVPGHHREDDHRCSRCIASTSS